MEHKCCIEVFKDELVKVHCGLHTGSKRGLKQFVFSLKLLKIFSANGSQNCYHIKKEYVLCVRQV